VAYAKQNLYVIKTLKEFQYIDEDGRDQVRLKAALGGLISALFRG